MKKDFRHIAEQVIKKEAEGLMNLSTIIDESFNTAVEIILATKGKVIVTGIGKSGHIGRKIAASFASTGTPSFYLHPSEAIHGDLGMISPDDTILAIANSGETPETLNIIPYAVHNNIPLIAISSKPSSTLALKSTVHLNTGNFKEACSLSLAPTTSTTLTLALGDALMVALIDGRGFDEESFAKLHPGGNLGRRLLETVSNIMIVDKLPLVKENSSINEIIFTINSGRLGVGIVVDDEKNVLGIITDGDLRRAMDSSHEKFFSLSPANIMTKTPVFVDADTKLIEAKNIMNSWKITCLLVGSPKKFEGIIQLHDINL